MAAATDVSPQAGRGEPASRPPSLWARALSLLPDGTMAPEVWERRHRAILWLLWANVPALFSFGLWRGYSLWHSLGEMVIPALSAIVAHNPRLSRRSRAGWASFGLLSASAVLVHMSGGVIEAHFHFFVVVTVIAIYQDRRTFALAILYVLVGHGLFSSLFPGSVFNHPAAQRNPWTWAAVHGFAILSASVASLIAWRFNEVARRSLRESEERFRAIFESTAVGVSLVDPHGRPVQSNRAFAELLGYTNDELKGKTVHELTHPDDRRASLELFSDVVAGRRQHYELEKRYLHKDGHAVWGHLTASPVRGPDGDVRFVLGMIADMRERKDLEERLRHAEKMEAVGKLAGGVAHEFNNLLAIMQHYTRFVADELPEGPAREDLEEVMKAGGRAADLVRQLLTFSRREEASAGVHDVNAVVSEIGTLLRSVLGEDIVLVKKLAPEALPARIDPGHIEQVLMNLAFNARDAMPGGGRLTIETGEATLSDDEVADLAPGRYVSLSVADTGSGMSEEVAARVFEPFFTTKRRGEGTGLGLATVYGIVKQSGGAISVDSEPGRGATFTILLPTAEEPDDEGPFVVRPDAARGAGQRVLVVEDEPGVRNVVRRILTGGGYEVETAASGTEALEVLARAPDDIDALVTDVVMPGMSGPELSERVRATHGPLPTVFMSGYADNLMTERQRAAEGNRFLQKPFTVEELLDEVRLALSTEASAR